MSQISTLQTNNQIYSYEELQKLIETGAIDTSKITDISVFNNEPVQSSECADGEDDGKISFGEGIKSFFKGAKDAVVNGVKGMFFDEEGNFSLKNTLKTVGLGAICMIPGVGPVVATGLCAYGAVKGIGGICNGISAASSATTDAEMKAALESIGANTLSTGLSVAGARAGLKGITGTAKQVSGSSAFTEAKGLGKVSGLIDDIKTVNSNYYGSAWKSGATTGQKIANVAKKGISGTGENIATAYKTTKEKLDGAKDTLKGNKRTYSNEAFKTLKKESKNQWSTDADGNLIETDGIVEKTYTQTTNKKGETIYKMQKSKGETTTINAQEGLDDVTVKVKQKRVAERQYAKEALDDLSGKLDEAKVQYQKTNSTDDLAQVEAYEKAIKTRQDELTSIDKKIIKKASKSNPDASLEGAEVKINDDGTATVSSKGKYEKVTTTKSEAGKLKNKKIEIESGKKVNLLEELKKNNNKVTAADGTVYELKDGVVTTTKTSPMSKAAYKTNQFVKNATYQGMTGQGALTAGFALASDKTGEAATNISSQASNPYQDYVSVDTQTGYQYNLEDYNVLSQEEIDQKYATIMNQAYSV